MLDRSQTVALIDAFPSALALVKDAVEAAAGRGVEVAVKTSRTEAPTCLT